MEGTMPNLAFGNPTAKFAKTLVGANFYLATDNRDFDIGDVCDGFVYVQASAAIAANATCGINAATNKTTAGTTHKAYATFKINQFGWVEKV
jgi:hypothetical protein